MQTVFGQGINVSVNVPFDAAQSALDESASAARSRAKQSADLFNRVRSIEDAHHNELIELLGHEGFERLAALRVGHDEWPIRPPDEPGSQADVIKRRAESKARVRGLLDELNVDAGAIRAINRATRAKILHTIPDPPSHDGQTLTVVPPEEVPKEIREGKANPWTVVRPPFPDWSWYYDGWQTRFGFTPTLLLDSNNGSTGNGNFLFNTNASDFDHAQIEYNASVAFWYRMPKNGRLDIYIEAQAQESLHQLTLDDEWGESDAFMWQESFIVAKADGLATDPWQRALTSTWKYDGDAEGHWSHTVFPYGTIRWARLMTQNWFPKDSWVRVSAGTTTWHRTTTNDMAMWSNIRFRWTVKSVWVETLG